MKFKIGIFLGFLIIFSIKSMEEDILDVDSFFNDQYFTNPVITENATVRGDSIVRSEIDLDLYRFNQSLEKLNPTDKRSLNESLNKKEKKTYLCKCNKIFFSIRGLQDHQVEHENKGIICEHCGKKYFYKLHFKAHIKSKHSDEKYKCSQCKKRYLYKKTFDKHVCKQSKI